MPPEAWNALAVIGVALIGVWVEVVRRTAKKGREEVTQNQQEVKQRQDQLIEQTRPISNGFAENVRSMLTEVLADMHNLKEEMKQVHSKTEQVQDSQVDLHHRLDQHLENHVPKQSERRRFFR